MIDYKELIDELRTCAEMGWFAPSEMQEAADAIEQLGKDIDALTKERDEWRDAAVEWEDDYF